jgi:hypothetical protein
MPAFLIIPLKSLVIAASWTGWGLLVLGAWGGHWEWRVPWRWIEKQMGYQNSSSKGVNVHGETPSKKGGSGKHSKRKAATRDRH